jgi:nuclear pore complex protein Nup133
MFSPEASIQSARSSLRNPRRRQRTSSGEPQAQPRRKRNKLTDETFVAKDDTHINGNGSALMNGHAGHSPESSLVVVDIPVREKKTPPKRPTKEDNGLYLVRPRQLSRTRHMLTTHGI